MEKISDIKAPENVTIELLAGKKAVVGPVTLDLICWVEDKYGDWQQFQDNVLKTGTKIRPLAEFLFRMLQNQTDFVDETDFLRTFPVEKINEIAGAITGQMMKSMPTANKNAVGGSEDGPEKK
jgi:hypothetical protein